MAWAGADTLPDRLYQLLVGGLPGAREPQNCRTKIIVQ